MIKLNLFQEKSILQDRIDIHYSEMQPIIQRIVHLVKDEHPMLVAKVEDETRHIRVDAVYYLDCVDKKVYAYTKEHVYCLEESLSYYEEALWAYGFVRISKSNVVNLYKIVALKPEINMRVCVKFDNDEKLYINRTYKSSFNEYLHKMKGVYVGEE